MKIFARCAWFVLIIVVLMLFVAILPGCAGQRPKGNGSVSAELRAAYMDFLPQLYSPGGGVQAFALKDLDNDGVCELIVNQDLDVAVYYYDSAVNLAGNRFFGTATTRFLFSNNPDYSGIFTFNLGGGIEHYGYMTVKDNRLVWQELWNLDYSGVSSESGEEPGRILEISDDKRLIEESRTVYGENNDIEFEVVMHSV